MSSDNSIMKPNSSAGSGNHFILNMHLSTSIGGNCWVLSMDPRAIFCFPILNFRKKTAEPVRERDTDDSQTMTQRKREGWREREKERGMKRVPLSGTSPNTDSSSATKWMWPASVWSRYRHTPPPPLPPPPPSILLSTSSPLLNSLLLLFLLLLLLLPLYSCSHSDSQQSSTTLLKI